MPTSKLVAESISKALNKVFNTGSVQTIWKVAIKPGPTSVTITFRTSQWTSAVVALFEDAAMSVPVKSGLEFMAKFVSHKFVFRGLAQNTKYWFRITAGGTPRVATQVGSFVTGNGASTSRTSSCRYATMATPCPPGT
jgi:hypothetical protein